jgi:hypothetical protein
MSNDKNGADYLLLNLRKFDPARIPITSKVLVIAKPGCGAPSVIKDILFYKKNKFGNGVLMSSNDTFNGLLPPLYTVSSYDDRKLEKLSASQMKYARENGRESLPPACAVIDSLAPNAHPDALKNVLMNGRQCGIFFVWGIQYPYTGTMLPPALRSQFDYIFIGKETNTKMRKTLFDQYGGMFPSFTSFCDVLDETTTDYGCMVIDQRAPSKQLQTNAISDRDQYLIENCVYWYKPEKRKPFELLKSDLITKDSLTPIHIEMDIPDLTPHTDVPMAEETTVSPVTPVSPVSPILLSDVKTFYIED